MKRFLCPILFALTACNYEVPCYPIGDVVCPPDTEPCVAADDETGGESALCTAFEEPVIIGETVECGGKLSEIEVMSDDAAAQYGVTDYAFETGAASLAGLLDFQPMPESFDATDPWLGYWPAALPGVTTHEGLGLQWTGYFSRVCCPQRVVEGSLPGLPESPTCAAGGLALNPVPGAWCLDMEGFAGAGLCVYPCSDDYDCPEPAMEFCDLTVPDPNSNAPGTCRYKSMPMVPTPHGAIDP